MTGGNAVHTERVEAGKLVVADASAVLEMILDRSVGIILYDRFSRRAAASQVRLDTGSKDAKAEAERVDKSGLDLLISLLRSGSNADDIEIFSFGAHAPLKGAPGTEALKPAIGSGCQVTGTYSPCERGIARRIEFEICSGRMLVEEGPGGWPDKETSR